MKKRILSLLLVTACVLSLVGCGSKAGEITEEAAARTQSEADDGLTYIDDNTVALASSFAAMDGRLQSMAQEVLSAVNAERSAAGLAPLAWSGGLADAASVRAEEQKALFSHTRPDGSDWYTVNPALVYGENLARNYNDVAGAMAGWMGSPAHKANILDGGFKTMGVGIYESDGVLYWAQEFGY